MLATAFPPLLPEARNRRRRAVDDLAVGDHVAAGRSEWLRRPKPSTFKFPQMRALPALVVGWPTIRLILLGELAKDTHMRRECLTAFTVGDWIPTPWGVIERTHADRNHMENTYRSLAEGIAMCGDNQWVPLDAAIVLRREMHRRALDEGALARPHVYGQYVSDLRRLVLGDSPALALPGDLLRIVLAFCFGPFTILRPTPRTIANVGARAAPAAGGGYDQKI
jgi:hypothetical protein